MKDKLYILIEDETDCLPSSARWTFETQEEAETRALEMLHDNYRGVKEFESFDDYDKAEDTEGIVKEELAYYSGDVCMYKYIVDWVEVGALPVGSAKEKDY